MSEPTPQRGPAFPAAPGGRPLAWHLGLLCATLLAPMLALEAFLLVQLSTTERALHETGAREAARRIALVLDRELTMLQGTLGLLATSDHLQRGDLAAFYQRSLVVPRLTGVAVLLRDRDGRRLSDTRVPPGAEPSLGGTGPGGAEDTDPETDRVALETGRPQVSGLLPGPAARTPAFTVVAPTSWPGRERAYLVSLVIPAGALDEVLRRESVPPSTVVSVSDRRGVVLARSAEAGRYVGKPLPLAGWEPTQRGQEGWVRTTNVEGVPVVLAYARSDISGWTAAVFMPEARFEAPLRHSLWASAALGALLVALAAALATVFARRIARPIAALTDIATQNGGTGVAELATPVREVNEVGRALAAARAASLLRDREREDLLLTLDQAQVLIRDLDGRITAWTSGNERLFGWTRAEAVGRLWHELLHTEFPRPLPEIEAELLAQGEWQGELRSRRRDGAEVVVASRWALRRAPDGAPLAVTEAFNDVTALRAAEARAQRIQAELMHVSRLSAMGAMATALAHELNQPLTAAANFANAARRLLAGAAFDPARVEDARQAMAEAADEAVRAGKIVRHLRELVSRGDGEKRLRGLNALVESSATLALAGAREQGVAVRFHLDPRSPRVLVDRVQVQQVVVNLVRNAVEAVLDGARREVAVATALLGAEWVEVSVVDTGPGLAEQVVDRLFEPFVTTKRHGMGVGLSICRSIVEQHGGRLTAGANPGGGTVFRFVLPVPPEGTHAN